MKISINEAEKESHGVRSWEYFYGIDHPEYLPYWLKYMRPLERTAYLMEAGKEFIDFKKEMLGSKFDWSKWQSTLPEHCYICVPSWIKEIPYEEKVNYFRINKDNLEDFEDEMLSKDFDWDSWKSKMDE